MYSIREFRDHYQYQILICRICGYRTPDIKKRKNISILLGEKVNKLYGFNPFNDIPGTLPTVLCSTCNLDIWKLYSKYFVNQTSKTESNNILYSEIFDKLLSPFEWFDTSVNTRSVSRENQCQPNNRSRMCVLGHSNNSSSLAPSLLGKRIRGRPKELKDSQKREVCWRCGKSFASISSKLLHKCPRRCQKLRLN